MKDLGFFGKHFEKEREKILLAINRAKEARDSAPSAMESGSDTQRNQNEKLVIALEANLKKFDKLVSGMPEAIVKMREIGIWSHFELALGNKKMEVLLVPEGLGGKVVGSTTFLSEASPLGTILREKKKGDSFEFNKVKGVILT